MITHDVVEIIDVISQPAAAPPYLLLTSLPRTAVDEPRWTNQQSAPTQIDVNDSIPVHIFCPYKLPATGDQFDRCPVGIEPEALGKAALSIPQKQAHETFARRSTPPLNDREIHIPV